MYVYKFLDVDSNVLYVGRTEKQVLTRIRQHFSSGHLPIECYENTCKIKYIALKSECDLLLNELYYINKFKPPYNTEGKGKGELSFSLPTPTWIELTIDNLDNMKRLKVEKYKKDKMIQEQEQLLIKNQAIKALENHIQLI